MRRVKWACAGYERAAVGRAMAGLDGLRRIDRELTRYVAAWDSPWARRVLPAVESAVEHRRPVLASPARPWHRWWQSNGCTPVRTDVAAGAVIGLGSASLVHYAPRLLLHKIKML
ncbi:hypothetical protein [Streptomyces flavidovirens]|uniref:Uncharacterized protein n=1 Tax=Streptomyces flavidovirens TaxID=67298 RepID=A0ABW6RMD2_9ACTN